MRVIASKTAVHQLRGSGGGGKGGSGGGAAGISEVPDGLQSKMFASIIDLVSEGPIEGFADENQNLLEDAVVQTHPTVVNGVVQNNCVLANTNGDNSTGKGYSSSLLVSVVDLQKLGSGAQATATVSGGRITAITITNGGTGYVSPQVVIPPAIGKAIFLDNIPLQREDGSYNFSNVEIYFRNGTQEQSVIPGFPSAEEVTSGGDQSIDYGTPVSFTITNPTADRAAIAIRVNGFYRQTTGGSILETSVTYAVYVTYRADGYVGTEQFFYRDTISGKTSSSYVRTKTLPLPKDNARSNHQWTFRVVRDTPKDNTLLVQDTLLLHFYSAISDTPFTYPMCALVGLRINAEDFKKIPQRSYQLLLRTIQVPSNYFPSTRLYNRNPANGQAVLSGGNPVEQVWDGTFYTAWSNNPAWIFYDAHTNKRYGFGDLGEGIVPDKWTLYKIGKYCDELVSDGYSGQEPRFTCNVYFQTREQAYNVIQDLASVFRGMPYWSSGAIAVAQDAPGQILKVFTPSNIVGTFEYSGTSRNTRSTVVLVRWIDPEDNFQSKLEYVPDPEGIVRFGVREAEITSFGCTSRGQAHRAGRALLRTQRKETETVSFKAGFEAAFLRPGDLIGIQDPTKAGVEYSGRVISISSNRQQVVLDRSLPLSGSNTAIFALATTFFTEGEAKPNGFNSDDISKVRPPQLVSVAIANWETLSDGSFALNFSSPISADVVPGAIWGIEATNLVLQKARILSCAENGQLEYEITAVIHDANKYAAIEDDLELESAPISFLPSTAFRPSPPDSAISNSELVVMPDGSFRYRITLSWSPPDNEFIKEYEIMIARGEVGNWSSLGRSPATSFETFVVSPDSYRFQIRSIGVNGTVSSPLELSVNAGDLTISYDLVVRKLELSKSGGEYVVRTPSGNLIYANPVDRDGLGNDLVFFGRDAHIAWANHSTNTDELFNETFGMDNSGRPLFYPNYRVTVYTSDYRTVLGVFTQPVPVILLTSSFLGINRSFVVEVQREIGGISSNGQATYSAPVSIRCHNPRPALPVGVTYFIRDSEIYPGKKEVVIDFPHASPNPDTLGYRIFVSQTNGFTPQASDLNVQMKAQQLFVRLFNNQPLVAGQTYYFRYAEYDEFAQSNIVDCEISSQFAVTIPA